MSRLKFKIEANATGSRARAARFQTLHGEVLTPVFMPVGTRATVRAQTRQTLEATGSQVLLANTYHLLLRPGPEVFKKFGGIHRFMRWDRPVLTDSGGYQIFSLPNARRMSEEGARFKSYLDGKTYLLSPEFSIEVQKAIGADIMMQLDECIPSDSDHSTARKAMELTHRWAQRSLKARGESKQALFGIVQGACFPDLRKESALTLSDMKFDGLAIGGLAVGETKEEREEMTALTTEFLPEDRPRYLMGVGTPLDLLEAIHRGVDMFDCIIPTALAQRGVAYTSKGILQLRRGVYRFSENALDPQCECETCKTYSLAYLHHLIKSEEVLGWHLLGLHNLWFYHSLTNEIRSSILEDRFLSLYREKRSLLAQEDPDFPVKSPIRKKRRPKVSEQVGDYEILRSPKGHTSIRQISSGEIMHSVNDPIQEANSLYIEQSGLERLIADASQPPLVIWDVGLGAATNAMAVIHAYERKAMERKSEGKKTRALKMISFENDLDSLKLALGFPKEFTYLKHPAPYKLSKEGFWENSEKTLSWELVHGDFLKNCGICTPPHLIFYDPFSLNTNSDLWTLEAFKTIYQAAAAETAALITYSASTAVRARLLAAGFFVAKGRASGPKRETTLAFTAIHPKNEKLLPRGPLSDMDSVAFLDQDWLERWKRSSVRSLANGKEA